MNRRAIAMRALIPLSLALAGSRAGAQVQQTGSPIDDLLRRAQDAFNDLNYLRADSLARQVLLLGSRVSAAQQAGALKVVAAAAYPEEREAHRRAVAVAALRQLVRFDMEFKMPGDLSWAGLDSLVDETKRTTFVMQVSMDSVQTLIGTSATSSLSIRASRPGSFRLTVAPAAGGDPLISDSIATFMVGEARFPVMRNERPIFSTGAYVVTIMGTDSVTADTMSARFSAVIEAPQLTFLAVPAKMDSSVLLPVRTPRFGAKAIFPAVLIGAGTFALSSVLRGEGDISTGVAADSKGIAVGGAIALGTIFAGFMDRGRPLPANVAANKAYGDAFQKAISDTHAENRRRIAEYKTIVHYNLETR